MSAMDDELGFNDLEDSDFPTPEELEEWDDESGHSPGSEIQGSDHSSGLEDLKTEMTSTQQEGVSAFDGKGTDDPFDSPVEVNYEREGFTDDDVTPSVFVSKTFPHFEILETEFLTGVKLRVLQNMLKGFSSDNREYPVYLTLEGRLMELGMVQDYQVRALIKSVGEENMIARLGQNQKLEGHLMFALST